MEVSRPRTSLSINIRVMRVLGLWFPEERHKTWRTRAYVLYAVFMQGFLFYTYMLSEIIYMLKVFGDIEKMTEVSFLLLTHVAQFFKNYCFCKHSGNMVKFLNELEQDVFRPKNEKHMLIAQWAMRRARTDSVTLLSMAFATCGLWALFPFIERTSEVTRLPLSGWYPFDVTRTPYFEIAFCYQIVAVTANAFSIISMDTTATGLFVHICAQIDMLNESLEHMQRDALQELLRKKQNDTLKLPDSHSYHDRAELEVEMVIAYKNCVLHHEKIIRYAEDIEDVFNMCFLAQFAASVVIICLTLFKISLVQSFLSIEFISLVLYQACIVFELLLYCWHGNEMLLKSDALSNAAYKCAWYEFSPKFARNIILLMVRSKRPIRATAGKFFLLSLSTFMGILRCSWSYFAVLNSMHNDAERVARTH